MQKFYCYVDETGQDTKGRFFLVVVVIVTKDDREAIEQRLLKIEEQSEKRMLKWRTTSLKRKIAYLEGALGIKELRGNIFYTSYHNTKEYILLVTQTIAQAVR